MLGTLLRTYGLSQREAARLAGVSSKSVRRWVDGETPSIGNAVAVAGLFGGDDRARLLAEWGYHEAAQHTSDPEVANGWRLDAILTELRTTNRLLQRLTLLAEPTYPSPGETHETER